MKGKVVSVGSPCSRTEIIALRMLRAAGLDPDRHRGRLPTVQVVLVGSLVGGLDLLIGEPLGHFPHPAGRLKSADRGGRPRARQVVERRERRAVRQPGCGLHDVGKPARATVGDAAQPSRYAPELRRDRRDVAAGDAGFGRAHVPGWASARLTDCHRVAYQAFAATCGLLAAFGFDWPETTW